MKNTVFFGFSQIFLGCFLVSCHIITLTTVPIGVEMNLFILSCQRIAYGYYVFETVS